MQGIYEILYTWVYHDFKCYTMQKPVRYGDHEGAFTFEQNVNRRTVLQIGDPQYDMCKPL